MEGDPAHPHKSPRATVHQNLGRRGDCSLDLSLTGGPDILVAVTPSFLWSFLEKDFAFYLPSSVPGSPEIPLLGLGGREKSL